MLVISRCGTSTPVRAFLLQNRHRQTLLRTTTVRLMSSNNYENILVSKPATGVTLITLNRPKALNALCTPLMIELNKALDEAQEDDEVGAVVLTGSKKAFAGAFGISSQVIH